MGGDARAERPIEMIDHLVVIYQENWAFDSLFGTFPEPTVSPTRSTPSVRSTRTASSTPRFPRPNQSYGYRFKDFWRE